MVPSPLYCTNCGAANKTQAKFCFSCGQSLQASAGGPAISTLTGLLTPNVLLKHRYRIISKVGMGGMGAVYKAEDTLFGNRLVAAKEMSQSGRNQQEVTEAIDAFKREAHMLANLDHQSLPKIHDYFNVAGRWYLAMDFIEGETLEDYLDKAKVGWLPVKEVLDISIQLCTVLEYLHTRQPQIIFRDLKPANVMHTFQGNLYLIDFGIARHFKPGQAKDTIAYGSAGYAAPEQFGKSQTTVQSDIYSLGAMLHQLLTGNDPSANTPTLFDFPPLQLHGQPPPAGLETLIMQMVEKVASKRPASMAEIKQELQRIAAQPAGKPPLPPTQSVVGSSIPPKQFAGAASPSPIRHPPIASQKPVSPPQPAVPRQPIQPQQAVPKPVVAARQVVLSPTPTPSNQGSFQRKVNQGISRRTLIRGLAAMGVAVAGAGIAWFAVSHNSILSIPLGTTLYTYRGHSGDVIAIAWSPDGKCIASGSADNTVQVWDATDGGNVYTFAGHTSAVLAAVWSPDGKRIASGSTDKTVQVWDATDGGNVYTYHGHSLQVTNVAWSPDGKRIASASVDKTVQVWDATDMSRMYNIYHGHTDIVTAVAWSPDGKRFASGSWDNTVQLWDAADGGNVYTYRGHAADVYAVTWSPDGKRIASGSSDNTVQLWNAADGGNVYTYRGHSSGVNALAWSPDGKHIASGSYDKTVQVWDAADGGNIYIYNGHSSGVNAVAWSPDGIRIASGSADKTVQVWKSE